MVDPCGRRTTHADGARPSTNLASGGDAEKKKGRETDKTMQWKHFALSNPLASNNHSNSNSHDRRSSSSDRGSTLAVTTAET